jgi:hypothetical protein
MVYCEKSILSFQHPIHLINLNTRSIISALLEGGIGHEHTDIPGAGFAIRG